MLSGLVTIFSTSLSSLLIKLLQKLFGGIMKNSNVLLTILLATTLLSAPFKSQAETCTDLVSAEIKFRDGTLLGWMIPETAIASLAALAFLGPAGILIPVTLMGGGTAYAIKHAKHVLKIYEGAKNGKGKEIERVWKVFQRKNPDVAIKMNFQEFAKIIHQADLNGSACSDEVILEHKDFFDLVISKY